MPETTTETKSDVKVEATPEPIISKPAGEFLDRAKWELETRLTVRREYEELFKIWQNNELVELEKKQNEVITKGLQQYFEDWKKEQKPPEPENIQMLLDQEYETFTMPVDRILDDGEKTERVSFTIRELPQAIEKRFYRQFKTNLLNKLSDLEALIQTDVDAPFEKKVKAVMELMDETFDVMADAVVMILNPFGHKAYVTKEWVQNNISSDRQWRVIEAQMKVNRLRDFFSKVSISSQNMMMMKSPNFQTLRTLVR